MNFTLKQAIFTVLAAIIIVGGYFSWQFISKETQPTAPPKNYKIGFLALSDKDVQSENYIAFKAHMGKLGYVEGKNVEYIVKQGDRNIKGDLEKSAKELNESGLDLILTGGTTSTVPLKELKDLKTSVYFLSAARPELVVGNLAAPEGLITGISEGVVSLAGKRLEFLKEIDPSIKKVASIIEKGHTTAAAAQAKIDAAAQELGIKTVAIEIEAGKYEQIFEKLKTITRANGIDGYIACTCLSNEKYAKELADYFRKEKIPSINAEVGIGAKLGWLATYSNNRTRTGELAAESVDRILKGTPISQIPVKFASDVLFELNLKTAKEIGITIPQAILSRANKVYQE
ncbi:hypothetical protein A3B05_02430 [Candidatus Giovannonibacteria bacterium RIFCSPLOWO2_01_FULL_43_160]|uniref:ABC transporter substrate-binding protein n=2 Tax=Candidatus Giovannoniibacteriota TaxID=1752738 RepID=A0A1F5XUL3_9BACT|nr:MAG: hypothetical protein UV72_C0002G0027 [Candidatus Giovannonibacteria bacterium GW2011_GWB1_43_13]OGF58458.1 MAG: hypothetical protein A2652_01650 [Candidatus Giovannonibacteria bacterium RIFCSPHIGHO2_01_FULL_43_140]OGF69895.1 MAG: hypothetical protein A3C76_02035 [Candidatus Giovannonibacteria bacterium RIFCSPHIGHO2_02_FULL_44_51]OGF71694.1 MAG: hypothetical protein A3E35_00405 [Candidatus Giovannonibacteria bacterium RIFCSPHIGHO2_12_FULL_44_22]OGF75472.1 MAG: hypothetical protein A3B05_